MDATVVEVRIAVGDAVSAGEIVAVLEDMTMEIPIRSDAADR